MSRGQDVGKRNRRENVMRIIEEADNKDLTPIDQVVELWDMYDVPHRQIKRVEDMWKELGITKSDKERFQECVRRKVEAIQACRDAERQCREAKMKYRSATLLSSMYGFYREADRLIDEDKEGLLRDLQNQSGFWEKK